MVEYEKVREMPLSELLLYFNALKEICGKYEGELRPLYNSTSQSDRTRWVVINNEYQHARMYFDVVLNAMKYKVYNGLDNYEKSPEKLKASKRIIKKEGKPDTPKPGRKKKA